MRYFIWGFIFLTLSSAWARNDECDAIFEIQLQAAQVRPLSIRRAEVHRQNNDIGLQQRGDLEFQQWFDLTDDSGGPESFIGLNKEGRIYHVVQWRGRTIARRLSGHLVLKKMWRTPEQLLIAADEKDQVYLFSPELWMKPAGRGKLKQGSIIWAVTMAPLIVGTAAVGDFALADWPVLVGGMASLSGFSTAFTVLYRFERENTFPNGFVRTDLSSSDLSELSAQLSQRDLSPYLSGDHFASPDLELLPPPVPEEATETIR